MKLDFDLLKNILPNIQEFSNAEKFEKQLFSVQGFDGAVSVIEEIRNTQFPCVLIEDIPDGYITYQSGFTEYRTVSIWALCKAQTLSAADRNNAYKQAFALSKKITALLIAENSGYDSTGGVLIDFSRVTYFPRGPFANNAFGYEFVYSTVEPVGFI